ncbi:MAG: MarC family protein [Flavobacteriales bacterium Tduv]
MEFIKALTSCFMILFSIIDIVGNTPIIMNFKSRGSVIDSKKIVLVALGIFLSFLFLGQSILDIIGIDVNSFSVAGSIVLFFIALELILGIEIHRGEDVVQPSIVPIAFPLIAGPGALTALISLRTAYDIDVIILALLLNMLVTYFVIKRSDVITKKIGKDGLNVVKKVFGIILLAFAVKLFAANAYELFKPKP